MLDKDVYELWDGQEKPYYKDNDLNEYEKEHPDGIRCVYNITEPTLTIFPAAGENSNKAVVIIPGGGYELVALYHEGYDTARALAEQGITAAVLKYRLPNPASSDQPHLVPLTDARRALELLREKAEWYGFRKDKVGVLGFSAGSHVATVAALWKSGNEAENPNFAALIYGVTNFYGFGMAWIERVLYFRELTDEETAQNTLLDQVTGDTPPTFLVHAYDDPICKVQESTLYAEKLHEHNVPVEMHLFPRGGHGFGMGRKEDGTDQWVQLFINWVKSSVV
ncbi:MAG: alpha/beta hydrolase [Anaerolineales bacterium]|nr:alpha/beta hydrolase [Anaerolineales bacterium]